MDENRLICRGKRKDTGRWVEGYYIRLDRSMDGPLHIIVDRTGQYNTVLPETVGECTGHLDKQGRLIFEGDILLGDNNKAPLVVGFEGKLASFTATSQDNNKIWAFTELDSSEIEIIGCIHEMQTEL